MEPEDEKPVELPFDPARLFDAWLRRWYLWLTAGLVMGGLAAGWYFPKNHTTAAMQLIRRDVPILFRASELGDAFKPQQFNDQTLVTLVRSPEIFQRVSERTHPHIPVGKLAPVLMAAPERDTDLVTLTYKGQDTPQVAIQILNIFAEEIVRFTQEMQAKEGSDVAKSLSDKLAVVETNLASVSQEMTQFPPELKVLDTDKQTEAYLVQLSDLEVKYELVRIELEASNPAADRLQLARDELATLLIRYTEAHPLVRDAQARVNALEKQFAASTNGPAGTNAKSKLSAVPPTAQNRLLAKQLEEIQSLRQKVQEKLSGLSGKNMGYAVAKNRYQSLQMLRTMLSSRQHEAELYAQNAMGYYQIFHPAGIERAASKINWPKVLVLIGGATLFGMLSVSGWVVVKEVADGRIKTGRDLAREAKAPLLATLGDLSLMSEEARRAWAFRAWTINKGKISHSEGRSTWIELLAQTAYQRGLRVLVAATRPTDDPPLHPHETSDKKDHAMKISVAKSVITFPFQAVQHLSDPKTHSIVHIPLPGWVWNLERRTQWQSALEEWQKMENLVFLVELPPACEPEAVLLAEKLPHLIWLADSGKATIAETREHIETLRHVGCQLAGVVLNHEPPSFFRKHLSRWLGTAALFLALSAPTQLQAVEASPKVQATPALGQDDFLPEPAGAQPTNPPPAAPLQGAPRAAWQQRLTLGPGDILTLGFYGDTNLTKSDVTIGLDGRINYLQAQNILAAGLTVDELRDALNAELAKYYRAPRAIVIPVTYRSKKYYVMGRVTTKGVYVLDRPISILEAVSRARGLETGVVDRNSVDLADLQRSFLLRQGKRVPVDFEKLFQEGDFSQNVSLEPEDFLYFAPASLKEVYVLGEVRAPGIAAFTEGATAIRTISERGGFTESAYTNHVMVIRGSLTHPRAFSVNSWAVLDGREGDFKLEPRDIIFVSKRPFLKVEELLDLAVSSFLESATTSWVGENVGPFIAQPILPKL